MRVGIAAFATDRGLNPSELAREVEVRGFAALVFPEHAHIPVSRDTMYPQVYGGGDLPDFYQRTYDPFVSCTAAAAATTDLKLGTGICLLALRDPIFTAKEVASVDLLSGGRFTFGVGFGWNADEFTNHGVRFSGRHAMVREKVALMRALWTEDEASYTGDLVSLTPSWAWPKPQQRPSPPVHLGGNGPLTMKHAAEWADVWYPTPPGADPHLEKSIPAFRELLRDAGRDPGSVPVHVAPGKAESADLIAWEKNGVAQANIAIATTSRDEDLRRLDELATLASDYLE